MKEQKIIRNVAIIAHVDHGKTTLIDGMLRQSGAFSEYKETQDRVMDSMDIEKERGITILAKNAAVQYEGTKINILDTPGHADFGGEVERALKMVDGVLLLVDSSEGPLPQTRFVLQKALSQNLPVVLVINKIDRPDARCDEVIDEVYELFIDLDASDDQIDFPIIYTDARKGTATTELENSGTDLTPLFEMLVKTIPEPSHDPDHPFQAWVTNLDASPYVGRIAICRIMHGTISKGQNVSWCKTNGDIAQAQIANLYVTEYLERVEVETAHAGEVIAISGIEGITIGETLSDIDSPKALPIITVDEPTLSVTIGTNSSPLAGKEGDKLTARLVKARLEKELVGNVSIRMLPTEHPDAWEIQGRGELQLAILVEMMRREGFELTVGKPEVVTREIDGSLHEPMEYLTIDIPEDYVGPVTQLLGSRKARMETMTNNASGWVRLEYIVAARALIGFRTEFLTETRGTGLLHHVFNSYEPWIGELRTRTTGSVVSDRSGSATTYAIAPLQERTSLLIEPGTAVYEGMIVGENSRLEDMNVNITKEKKMTNVRAAASDNTIRLTPPRIFSLEQALEFIAVDECIEVTPETIRLRKTKLAMTDRARESKRIRSESPDHPRT